MAIKMVLQRALEDEYMQQIRDLGVNTVVVKSEEDILSEIGDADAYFGGMSPQILNAAKKLRWVQATSAGLDGYYFPELRKSDLTVTNIRGIYSDVIADHVFSMVMAFARGLHHYIRNQSRSKWEKGAPVIHLAGTTLGVVGLGGIGLAVAERGPVFGMRVVGMDPAPKGKPDFIARIYSPDELSDMVGESDFVVICVPHTAETEGLFNADMFRAMKNTGILINIGRGKVVQLHALTSALQSGQIRGAGLDVYEEEPLPQDHALWSMENVILTPHVAGVSPEIDKRRKALIVENVRRFCAGEPLLNVVDNQQGYVVDATSIYTMQVRSNVYQEKKMANFKAGVIGCGGRGKAHARGWTASDDVALVACADPFEAPRSAYMAEFGVENGYEDYRDMLEKEDLDFVSVCTWTGLHHDMIVDAAGSGIQAIHAEKPMAPTWGEAKSLYQACVDNDVVITFCHQRRFAGQFIKAKEIAKSGAIGEVLRFEGNCPNMFDWGTHWFDMFFFYNDDEPAEWVIGQIDAEGGREVFGTPVEGSGVSWIRYQNGREGLLVTGGTRMLGIANRLIGSEGFIEIGGRDAPPLRVVSGTQEIDVDLSGMVSQRDATTVSVLDLVDAVKNGREPELSGRKALQATELIFATYESSRRRGRVELPLNVDDSALLSMLEDGTVKL